MENKKAKMNEMPVSKQNQKAKAYAVIPAILAPLSFMFQFGYNIGTMNAAANPIKRFFNESHVARFETGLSDYDLEFLWTIAKTGFPIGGAIGSFLVSPFSRLGPKKALTFNNFICVTGSVLIALSSVMRSHEAFIIANMMLGIFCAIGEGIGAGYINDISIPRLRATLGSTYAIALTSGLTLGNIFGLEEALGSNWGWPFLLAINAVPSLLFLAYYKWVPESPRFMFMKTRDETKVLHHLSRLYGTTTKAVEYQLNEYKTQLSMQKKGMSLWQVIRSSSVRWQVLSAIVIVSSIQATGINGIMYNLNNVLATAGVAASSTPYISIGVSAIQVLSAVIAGIAAKKFGRKTLFLFGNSLLASSCVVYTLSLGLLEHVGLWISYVAIIATVGFSVGLNSGSGVIAFVVAPEILTQASRAAGMGVAVFFFWLSFVVVSFATPYMFIGLKFAALLPYLAVAISIMVFVYFVVPETKDVSSADIEKHFEKRNQNGCCGGTRSDFDSDDYTEGNTANALTTTNI